jgi:hypothetical protein
VKRRPLHVPRFREPVQPPATGEDRLDRTDARKGKIMAGSQRSHVTAMSPHAGTRQNGLAFRKLEANRINQIAAGVTGWIPIKRFRVPLARDKSDLTCSRNPETLENEHPEGTPLKTRS